MSDSKSHAGGTNVNKDVIYIDIDDEITAIIDKIQGSSKKIVALVLPKRATVLQSVVNMKLLKRTADQTKKNVVLITGEAGLLPLAGSVGIHVARSLNSKPEVPDTPQRPDDRTEAIEEDTSEEEAMDTTKTVGELSGASAATDEDETIELDDEDAAADTAKGDSSKPIKSKDRTFKIPNFNKFRVLVVVGVLGLIVLIGGVYAAAVVMPKAKIVIKTDSSAINSSTVVTLKVGADTKLDPEQGIVPAQPQEVKKTLTQQVAATGQLNNGDKAAGTVSVKNCTNSAVTIPAGTGVSSGGLTFITDHTVSLSDGNFTSGGVCKSTGSHVQSVDVTAQQGGAKYNIASGATFAVAGYASTVSGTGGAMVGGTDNITKVVTQNDIDSAKQKIGEQDTTPIKQELKTALIGRDLLPIEVSLGVGAPETKSSAEVNAPADTVTVTQTITYTMQGVKEEDLKKIIENDVKKKIDTTKQSIVNYGLSKATFSLQTVNPDGASVTMQATAVTGAELNAATIKKQVAGKKAGAAKELIKAYPGVTDVTVTYSPFWVSAIPKNSTKITVVIQEPQVVNEDASDAP